MGPDPAVAAVRLAVRRSLAGLPPSAMVLAACSGGADSLALAAALAFEAPRSQPGGRPAGGVTIDHGLQEGSAARAAKVVRVLADLGLDPAGSVAVVVGDRGGIENAAREARYAALDEAAVRLRAAAVLLGHTRDDQAETVLLGLARGSGARSLAGMPPSFVRTYEKDGAENGLARGSGARSLAGMPPSFVRTYEKDGAEKDGAKVRYLRPLLDLDRATTRRACEAMGLDPWDDPHNDDPAFTRVRVRHEALPALEKALGPGVAEALARTARLLRDDADALDDIAARAYAEALVPDEDPEPHAEPGAGHDVELDVERLVALPRAVRTRVLRMAAIRAGSPPGTLAAVHVEEVDRLITAWRGQRHVDLPGGLQAIRRYGRLLLGPGRARPRDASDR
ncbi:tRNA(Ile)-lysidine synthase [Actinomadura sp. NBRC 104412]|uniref:tRNA lysidine(34) synthetase n=1 Tax=Actinomadura sp. NBRC 104412 TaxID=3032203 RepID=UPI0024A501B2|nr:tRNA lysidine(34) synthetase TilS [Actinomadura sp. NBRC 104412]GLZ06334.1 tRNA(Ile)-lysidine synthase [Actinomadura sp. NBRC 104412]